MLRTIVMAAIGKVKPPTLEVPPTTYGSVGTKTQIRSFQTNSSPVYKTQSDSSIINGMKGLNLSNKQNRNVPKARRSIYGGSGERIIKSLNDLAQSIKEDVYKNVVVVAGAGISTPSGIPDFRSPGTGLYDNLQQYRIPYPEAIFDIDYFHQNPRPFFTLAKELYPTGKYRPNYIHYFVRLLHDKGLLLRMYTQNIDGLERLAGLPEEKLVEAHGTFSSATCVICKHKHETTEVRDYIFKDKIPICKKRGCPGIVKPDIVFFGEDLPRRFYYYLKDMINTDLVIIMGTSLEVQPFAGIVDTVKWNIPRVLFNMHAVGPFRYQRRSQDVVAEGDMIESLEKFTDNLNWKNEMVELITNSEGSYKVRTVAASPYKPPPPPKGGPIQNAFMRESARLNLYTGSDSSESETEDSSTETETSSSDDDETPRARSSPYKRGTINRTRGGKTNGALTRNGYDNSKSGKRNGVLEPTNGNKNKRNYSTTTTTERPRGTPVSVRSVNSDKSAKTGRSKSVEQNSKDHSNNNRTKSGEINSKGDKSKYRARSVDGSAKGDNQSTSRSDISDLQNVRQNKTPTNKTMLSGKNDSPTKTKGMKKALSERSLESKVTTKALEGRLKRTSSAKNVPNSKENETEKSEENQETTSLVNDENNPLPKRDKPPVAATKPPLPKPTVPKELQALNTRPYGYLANRRLTGRPTINKNNVIADKTTNKFIRDMLSQRASSAEVPKIAYRHRLQTRQFYDARILSYNGSENQESSGEEESSSDSC